ncbi:alcohol dehydrogenase [Staphylococcus piscifermentans]|uniref:Quinone oxidoreductase n=1 Tax=Staphylococcus piscifermentans TaxID=70258 RepID=A0A239TP18_9STAP|nr:acryloyl-CoA reductase [Staphylococcus piscifermentans]RTX85941.1 acryloyl-CoA reductase [Staphylococcus piscifermentans]GEP85596.1 quinone oxidoreductase [Staphylococcus piscifermentans]SNU99567.1 alcohol dehydrogenase [Staphylococcus piscifermentans]
MTETFQAYFAEKKDGKVTSSFKNLPFNELDNGDVLVRVDYTSINFKDALAAVKGAGVVKEYPIIPGIDLAGTVVESDSSAYKPGDKVIVTSYDLGVTHHGGFSEYARVKEEWVVALPKGLTLEEAMIYGTAGYTAALAIQKLEDNGLTVEGAPVLVRGASGGVGSLAVMMLSNIGYKVVASTGNDSAATYLKSLGAKEIIPRLEETSDKPLGKREWQAVIDPVGGSHVGDILKHLHIRGSMALIGNTDGIAFDTTVLPFILRGNNLLGVDSVETPMLLRKQIWRRLATDLKPEQLHTIKNSVNFKDLPEAIDKVLSHQVTGRYVVKVSEE